MVIFWSIRYLDRRDATFRDRGLWLDTEILDLVTRGAVELVCELGDTHGYDGLLRYRDLFSSTEVHGSTCYKAVWLPAYFEDETGTPISFEEMGPILTGNADTKLFPAGTKDYEIEYAYAKKEPINLGEIRVQKEQHKVMGYFARDLDELLSTTFFREGPGTITKHPGDDTWTLETAVTHEEIRSFVSVFRRLYMEREPANLPKAATVFSMVFHSHPISRWVAGAAEEWCSRLDKEPSGTPGGKGTALNYSRRRLIDVFLYTQFAHQPTERRARQYRECMASVDNDEQLLTWMFLSELWQTAILLANPGRVVKTLFESLTESTKVPADILSSVLTGNPSVGRLETKRSRTAHLFDEKAEQLAQEMWIAAGSPESKLEAFRVDARELLLAEYGKTKDDIAED